MFDSYLHTEYLYLQFNNSLIYTILFRRVYQTRIHGPKIEFENETYLIM